MNIAGRLEAAWLARLAPFFAEFGAAVPVGITEIYKTFLDDDDALQVLLETRPAVVSFHFGVPEGDRIAALRDAGIRTMATATNLREAEAIAAAVEGPVAAICPGSVLQLHPHATVVIDEAAASKLQLGDYFRHVLANKPADQPF